jgi:hypothetical protein
MVATITDANGDIDWKSNYSWQFWDNPGCEPGTEIYKWIKIKIWCCYYDNSGENVPEE